MTAQGDWLDHARRHLDRAQWHRDRGGEDDLVYARNELVGAISDIWTAAGEIEAEVAKPHVIHMAPSFGEDVSTPCGAWLHARGEWGNMTRITTDPAKVTCPDCLQEMSEPSSSGRPNGPQPGLVGPEKTRSS